MKKKIKYHNGESVCNLCKRTEKHYQYGRVRDESIEQSTVFLFDYFSKTQQQKTIFDGKTGTVLNSLLEERKINRHNIYFVPAITCADFKCEKVADMYEYHEQLLDTLEELKDIKKIITFGAWAIQTLLKRKVTLKELRQNPFKIGDIEVFCTFGFGQVMVEPGVYNDIVSDVKQALAGIQPIRDTIININQPYQVDTSKKYFSLDVETEGFNSFKEDKELLSIGITQKEGESFVYNCAEDGIHLDSNTIQGLVSLISRHDYTMIGHNIKFDWMWLKNKFDDDTNCKICDTKTMYIILDENSQDNGLKYLASKYTDIPKNYSKDIDANNLKELAYSDFPKLAKYNGRDADATLRLYNILLKEVQEAGKENLLEFLNDVLLTICHIEHTGIHIDFEYMERESKKCYEQYKAIEDSYSKFYPGLNLDSPKQLIEILYNKLGLPIIKTTEKGTPSTDKETLKYLLEDHATTDLQTNFLDDLLVYSKQEKLYKTYFLGLPKEIASDGRIHTSYNLGRNATAKGSTGTVTGRLSSSNPNLTNIPRTDKKKGIFVRGCFAATKGYKLIDADYSQLELRVGAWYSKEKKMYALFEKGEDIHTSVLSTILKRPYQELQDILNDEAHKEYSTIKNTRVIAKSINFGIFYGAGANTIKNQARQAGLKITKEEAQEMINKWLGAYPKVNAWINRTKQHLIDNLEISSPTGRTRHLLGANRQDEVGFAQLRQGVNFPIQTLASEICLAGLIEVEKELKKNKLDANIVLTVHDSIIVEYKDTIEDKVIENVIKSAMTNNVVKYFMNQFNFNFNIPLEVSTSISERWQ